METPPVEFSNRISVWVGTSVWTSKIGSEEMAIVGKYLGKTPDMPDLGMSIFQYNDGGRIFVGDGRFVVGIPWWFRETARISSLSIKKVDTSFFVYEK